MRLRAATTAVLAGVVVAATSGCIRFSPPESFSAGLAEGEVADGALLGDVTGDGTADVLVTTSTGLVRYEVCGTDCFDRREHLPGLAVQLVGDVDGDGIDDVHVGTHVLFGGPAGGGRPAGLTLADAVALPAIAASPRAAGDFNGDGHLDLLRSETVFTYYVEHTALLGDGAGGFGPGPSMGLTGPLNAGVDVVRVGDVDGDGRDDVVGSWGTDLVVTTIDGDSLTVPRSGFDAFAVGDIDGDGLADLAYVEGQQVRLLKATNVGFVPFPPYQVIEVVPYRSELGLRDVDGDGATDLLVADADGTDRWYGGTADGGFPYPGVSVPPDVAVSTDAAFGDVDGDGLLDVVAPDGEPSAGVSLYRNDAF